jgi:hypothetical protein
MEQIPNTRELNPTGAHEDLSSHTNYLYEANLIDDKGYRKGSIVPAGLADRIG